MADKTKIEWADATWNPIRARNRQTDKIGWHCEHVSPGCEKCYSETLNAKRFGTGLPFKPGHRKDVEIFLDEKMLLQPLRWKKPRMIFVCSMTDLFADFVTDEWIDKIFAIMALAPQHVFQVLTKRPARMREYVGGDFSATGRVMELVADRACDERLPVLLAVPPAMVPPPHLVASGRPVINLRQWPLPNVWLGVSVEDQTRADERIPILLHTPAAVRWISAEPLLGGLDLTKFFHAPIDMARGLDWVVVGGESGPGARPMHPDWARQTRDQCIAAGIAFFFKQWGEWSPGDDMGEEILDGAHFGAFVSATQFRTDLPQDMASANEIMFKVGKARAGRLLDGREWNEMPGGNNANRS